MTSEDLRSVTFEQVRKGYRSEDVDDFLLQVASDMDRVEMEKNAALSERDQLLAERDSAVGGNEQFAAEREQLISERNAAIAAKDDAEAKLYVLATKVEEYRGQEDTLKTALINAQRMGETVVYEAKQKSDQMLRDATNQTELLRQRAEDETDRERRTLERLHDEVKNFKTTILNLYKQHIESLSALDPPAERAEKVLDANQPAPPREADELDEEVIRVTSQPVPQIEIPGPPVDEDDSDMIIVEEEELVVELELDETAGILEDDVVEEA